MRRRVISAGDSLKDFHGRAERLGQNRNGLQFRTLDALGGLIDIPLCEGEFTHENFTVLGWGPPLHPTPHNHIKNS